MVLHVGAGTFLPIPDGVPIEEHQMHSEIIEIKRGTVENLLQSVKNKSEFFLPIGTTSVRTLESLYWIGTILKLSHVLNSQEVQCLSEKDYGKMIKEKIDLDFYYDTENTLFSLGQWDCYKLNQFFEDYPNILMQINNNQTELITEETLNKIIQTNLDEYHQDYNAMAGQMSSNLQKAKEKNNNGLKAHIAFKQILDWMDENNTDTFHASTQLMIRPGYKFAMCDALMTNFHQPKSTLLLLVSALLGNKERTMTVYNYALQNDFRFLSYGDSSILLPPKACLLQTKGK